MYTDSCITDQWMGFYWKDKKDQLFARRGQLPETSSWTTFQMDLREPTPMPVAFDFIRFLSSSITFMVHLREVSVFLDEHKLAVLSKDPGNALKITIPRGLKTTSPSRTMIISSITSTRKLRILCHEWTLTKLTALHIEALVARCVYDAGSSKPQILSQAMKALKPATAAVSSGFFSSLFSSFASPSQPSTPQPMSKPLPEEKRKDPMEFVKSSVVLHVFSAEVDVRLDKKMIAELQRSTKKNPPTRLRYDLIYVCARISMSDTVFTIPIKTGKSEYDASKAEDDKFEQPTGSVFQGLRADLEG